jgi:predicted N-acyltransferase
MADGAATTRLTLHTRIAEIDPAAWDRCATPDDNPFTSHAFLSSLEDSGSVGSRTGWLARHASVRDRDGTLAAVAPLYVKSHSYGEYVFDHAWADAFERAGGRYYPKLQVAVPFSPVPGPRLMIRPGAAVTLAVFADALRQACSTLELSSVHVTFCTAEEWHALGAAGWLQRQGLQFHWHNPGYHDFEDFLASLAARKRKTIRRERREVQEQGLTVRTLEGREIEERHWDAFYRFYLATIERKWGGAYLTRRFFSLLGERLPDRVVLMMAEKDGRPVAGALNLRGRDTLFGRNWGAIGDFPFLHFELCYYRAIDYAIAHGLARVEAGAQGEHKLARGYLPAPTYSAHWLAHPGLRRAVGDFLAAERLAIAAREADLQSFSPFRNPATDEETNS